MRDFLRPLFCTLPFILNVYCPILCFSFIVSTVTLNWYCAFLLCLYWQDSNFLYISVNCSPLHTSSFFPALTTLPAIDHHHYHSPRAASLFTVPIHHNFDSCSNGLQRHYPHFTPSNSRHHLCHHVCPHFCSNRHLHHSICFIAVSQALLLPFTHTVTVTITIIIAFYPQCVRQWYKTCRHWLVSVVTKLIIRLTSVKLSQLVFMGAAISGLFPLSYFNALEVLAYPQIKKNITNANTYLLTSKRTYFFLL